MELKYHIFGSENSQDYDVAVEVESIPNIKESHNLIKNYEDILFDILPEKPLNLNLIVIKDGIVIDCFKGTPDELNNSIYYTFGLHKENKGQCPVRCATNRDIPLKIVRVSRFLITFFSRTHLRSDIKVALRSGKLSERIKVLGEIDYTEMTEFPHKKEKVEDIYKVIAFQFGQVFSLLHGYEGSSYTKSGIADKYRDLSPFLYREEISKKDLQVLNSYLDRFIQYSKIMMSEIGDITE